MSFIVIPKNKRLKKVKITLDEDLIQISKKKKKFKYQIMQYSTTLHYPLHQIDVPAE